MSPPPDGPAPTLGVRPPRPARRIAQSLAADLRHAAFSLVANTILGSALVPRVARILGYRLLGMDVRVVDVFPGVRFKSANVTLGST